MDYLKAFIVGGLIFTGGLTAASGGVAAALVFGFLVSIIFRSKSKK